MISTVGAQTYAAAGQAVERGAGKNQAVTPEKPREIGKAEAIKEALAKGEYRIDVAKVASKMASDLL